MLQRRAPLVAYCARAWSWLVRLQTLPISERVFSGFGQAMLSVRFAGYRLFVDVGRSSTERLLWFEGERFVAERYLLAGLSRAGMRAIDVGANLGYYALLLARVAGASGRIDCFEPEPDNLLTLEVNVRANDLRQVHIHPEAVGNMDGHVRLERGLNGVVGGNGAIEVRVCRLDTVIRAPVDLLKIDIEGYEGHALRGAAGILSALRPNLLVELHPALLAEPDTIGGLVTSLLELYPDLEFWEPLGRDTFPSLLASRYLPGRGVRRIHDLAALLAACQEGQRTDPFWAIGRRPATHREPAIASR